ncbi:hypothetical protein Mpt1_c08700 [Candidatus Methanoplasma termitum]|uniref:Bacteriocin-protection, YdeI or OmpD-Associated n=1 Tax=Candidatus Methanoplasma termitum TaxID=1577791 RepID=A0A0A7LGW4_9ARCH|nr:YdeI/OmpD-associated family protein [Candidatus Methanoplasma termitum]AIZ56746.1 hypothetical protein Mpt1_c08700 [Candidatus Methanoplasma termitum]MCL2333986.1 YdeI/OmpD-associated family protein [Candidatus Methanoplasma sp.]
MKNNIVPHRFETRAEWRKWLQENFDKRTEVWFVFPLKASGEIPISYNDAVEEALCFGWIDSTVRSFDETHKIQRFTPRNPKSTYSQPNKERLRWLAENGLIHPAVMDNVSYILDEQFVYPDDIIDVIKKDGTAWTNFQKFSDPYKRIRIAFIDAARDRPDEFTKRLNNFLRKTHDGKMIIGYGGIDKYY